MQRGTQVRACDRPNRDHHPGREQVADRDERDGVDAGQQDDERRVQNL